VIFVGHSALLEFRQKTSRRRDSPSPKLRRGERDEGSLEFQLGESQ